MSKIKCIMCGGEFEINDNETIVTCEYCGNQQTLPKLDDEKHAGTNDNKKKNRKIKPWILIVGTIVLCAVVAVIVFLSISENKSSEPSVYIWDDVLLKSHLPEPPSTYGELTSNDADNLSLTVENISFSDYETYLNECIDMGYTFVIESDASSYKAYNSEGCELKLEFEDWDDGFELEIDLTPRVPGIFKWSSSNLATLLPVPSSNVGDIRWDYTCGYEVYVGNTTKAEFDAYISECEARGFDFNVQRQDTAFYAENNRGYELIVEYYGCDLIHIDLEIPDEIAEAEGLDD